MTVGAMAGVPLGGLIADVWGWRAVFLVKLPVVIAVLWVGLRTITRIPHRGLPRPGAALVREALLLGGAVAVLLLAFEEVDARPLGAAVLAVGAIAALMVPGRRRRRREVLVAEPVPA
jgi:MFS transporter, DHA2 family, multidrug resistance protein